VIGEPLRIYAITVKGRRRRDRESCFVHETPSSCAMALKLLPDHFSSDRRP
jgi:hypothetical protein